MNRTSKFAAAATAAVLAFAPFATSASTPVEPPNPVLSAQMRTLIQTEIAMLLLQLQQLQQQLAALESQNAVVISTVATTTPGTIAVSASTTPSTAVLKPTITVSVNGTSFAKGQPMTVTWKTNVAFGIDSTRLPYLELFPYGANPIIVPSVRVARPGNGATSYVWFVSKTGILSDTVTSGKYLVQIGLYYPQQQTYIIGATPVPVTISL